MPAGEFIEIAEETGAIVQVGELVLERRVARVAGGRRMSMSRSMFRRGSLIARMFRAPFARPWRRPGCPRTGSRSRSPSRPSCGTSRARKMRGGTSKNSVSGFPSTTLGRAIRASAICTAFRSTRSRSTARSWPTWSRMRDHLRCSSGPRVSVPTLACASPSKGSRRWISSPWCDPSHSFTKPRLSLQPCGFANCNQRHAPQAASGLAPAGRRQRGPEHVA